MSYKIFVKIKLILIPFLLFSISNVFGISKSIPLKLINDGGTVNEVKVEIDELTDYAIEGISQNFSAQLKETDKIKLNKVSQMPTCDSNTKGHLVNSPDETYRVCDGANWKGIAFENCATPASGQMINPSGCDLATVACPTCSSGYYTNPGGCQLPCVTCPTCGSGTFSDPTGCSKPCLPCSSKVCPSGQTANAVSCLCENIIMPTFLDIILPVNNPPPAVPYKFSPNDLSNSYSFNWRNQAGFPGGTQLKVIGVSTTCPSVFPKGILYYNRISFMGCLTATGWSTSIIRITSVTLQAISSGGVSLNVQSTFSVNWYFVYP